MRRVVLAAALALAAYTPLQAAAQNAEDRQALAEAIVARFVNEKKAAFDAKTQDLRKKAEALNCPAPTVEFGDDGLPGPTRVTIEASRKTTLPPPVARGSNILAAGSVSIRALTGRGGSSFATNTFSGDMLNLPTAVPFRVTARAIKIEQSFCRDRDGRRKGRIDRLRSLGTVDITRIAASSASFRLLDRASNVSIDRGDFLLRPVKPGPVLTPELQATDMVRLEAGPCGPGTRAVFDGQQIIPPQRVGHAFEVTDVEIVAQSQGSGARLSGDSFNLFFGETVTQRPPMSISLFPNLVIDGAGRRPPFGGSGGRQSGRFLTEVAGGGPFTFDRRGDTLTVSLAASAIGAARVTMSPVGARASGRTVTVNANRVLFEAGPNLNDRSDRFSGEKSLVSVPAGSEATSAFIVEGPGDLSGYSAEWTLGLLRRGASSSSRRSVLNGSAAFEDGTARFTFDAPIDEVRERVQSAAIGAFGRLRPDLQLTGRMVEKGGRGGVIAQKRGKFDLLSPTLQSLKLSGKRRSGGDSIEGGVIDLFRGSAVDQSVDLQYELSFDGGLVGPTGRNQAVGVQQDSAALLALNENAVVPVDGDSIGTAKLRAFLRPSSARANFLTLAGDGDENQEPSSVVSNSLTFTVNNAVYIIEPGEQFTHRIVVRGPANMRNYRAVFDTTDGVRRRSFSIQGDDTAQAEAGFGGRTVVRGVDLVNSAGQVVARFDQRKTPSAAPTVRLHTPEAYVQGEVYQLFGAVSNISDKLARTSVCEWTLEPGFGAFLRRVTPMAAIDERHAECVNAVVMDEKKETVGQFPFVELRILFGLPAETIEALAAGEGDG